MPAPQTQRPSAPSPALAPSSSGVPAPPVAAPPPTTASLAIVGTLAVFFAAALRIVTAPPPYPLLPSLICVASLTLLVGFAGVPTVLSLLSQPGQGGQAAGKMAEGDRQEERRENGVGSVLALLVWPGIVALPLYMTYGEGATTLFTEEMWAPGAGKALWAPLEAYPSPLGLSLGLGAVVVGMVPLVLYHALRRAGVLGGATPIQREGAPSYDFWEGVRTHVAQPEGFALLGMYLIGYWMSGRMPASYYEHEGGIHWGHVAAQLLVQDLIQYLGHLAEHRVSHAFYRISHKPHHHYTNPRLFDAFSAAPTDTVCMILLPLFLTSLIVPANVWSYMTFGATYAHWLTLIHSEFTHPWDPVFRRLGFGTPADHHVHHKLFKYNFSHLFLYWDRFAGTYRDPALVRSFNAGV